MTGPALARELLLLAARSSVLTPADEVADAHAGWPVEQEAWEQLARQVDGHRGGDPLWDKAEELGLAPPGRWLLYLCAAVELYPEAAAAASIAAEDARIHLVTPATFARIVGAISDLPYREALREAMPGCATERFGLVERAQPLAGLPVAQQPIVLTAAAAGSLLGADDHRPEGDAVIQLEPPAWATAYDREAVAAAARLLAEERILCVSSTSSRAGRQLGMDVASLLGRPALIVEPSGEKPPEAAWVGALRGGLVVLDTFPFADGKTAAEPVLRRLAADLPALVAVVPENVQTGTLATVEVEPIGFAERARVWSMVVSDGAAADLSSRFVASLPEARRAVRTATRAADNGAEPDVEAIAAALCADGARRMGRTVSRLHPRAGLEDLVASDELKDYLRDILAAYRTRTTVYGSWQMGDDSNLGRGLTCLFSGPPGTGKTFAAQCLAHELSLNLYRIDLSRVVSKYIGETEKALANVFDEAESGHGILLFDEADALFGKRSEVKDAHDRYANIEVDFLLQRMEAFDGISILTTNLQENLDKAFYRRLSFVLHFPMPDLAMRRRLWERFLPPPERRPAGLDVEPFVERFVLAGANIRNIGIAAAHMAAAESDEQLTTDHLLRATYRELEKAGLSRSREDFSRLTAITGGKVS